MIWTYDRADRLAAARDHARGILDALTRRRADAVRSGLDAERSALDARRAATERRWRRLCACARRERRALLSP